MDEKKDRYYIGELAEYFGVSRDTLRWYDRVGIVSPKKDDQNQYRIYTREDFICLDYVMRLRKLNMSLEDIKQMLNDCTIEQAERMMQGQLELLEMKIQEMQDLYAMALDYQRSFSNAIQTMGRISVEMSPRFIYMNIDESTKDSLEMFQKLTKVHVPRLTFVASKEDFLDREKRGNLYDYKVRKDFFRQAITLVDDENYADREDFPADIFKVIEPRKCVHCIYKIYTGKDFSEFYKITDYIEESKLELAGNVLSRMISVRNDIKKSVDYYELWAPVK